ncbi:Txe/YoeB family addiction module toxin [Mycobacterium sp.]|uniref:Txe/YoeB family addiction module toxin n=1 Tax=Mycobacterium sp. TaxID=1785 RepID=UPI003F98F623
MNIVVAPQAWEDYVHWQTADRAILKRINKLISETSRSPNEGIGKPEPLKYGLSGAWSRRITEEQRLVYRVVGEDLQILQARYHY